MLSSVHALRSTPPLRGGTSGRAAEVRCMAIVIWSSRCKRGPPERKRPASPHHPPSHNCGGIRTRARFEKTLIGLALCARVPWDLQGLTQGRREALRLARGRDQHHHDFGGKEIDAVAADALVERQGGGGGLLGARGHLQHLIDAGRL